MTDLTELESLEWLRLNCGLTIYVTDIDHPHHVTPAELARLLATTRRCHSEHQLSNAYRAWRKTVWRGVVPPRSTAQGASERTSAAPGARRVGKLPPRRAQRITEDGGAVRRPRRTN